jgi:hypothetical protein
MWKNSMKSKKVTEMQHLKISGKVNSVCKMKGCWMEIADGKGGNTRIRFKDYTFFVPRDCEGQKPSHAQGCSAL